MRTYRIVRPHGKPIQHVATATRGILTDYSSGPRGARLNPNAVQTETQRFLTDLNLVYPGVLGAGPHVSTHGISRILSTGQSNQLAKGSYTCYKPGQFTTIAGLEGTAVGDIVLRRGAHEFVLRVAGLHRKGRLFRGCRRPEISRLPIRSR